VNGAVLVLNQNYEPLNICNLRRAIVLVFDGKAEVLEANGRVVHSASQTFPAPSVIRMVYLIHRPHPRVKLTRKEVFIRDGYTCQYCGRQCHDLTIDHVVPRSRGGPHSWDNLVSACKPCNHRKGGKLLGDARMTLRKEPREPRAGRYYTIERRIEGNVTHQWSKFLPGFTPISMGSSTERGGSRAAR
jgi:5-methylcytosine-specific restriction endonuclease McrA